MKKKTWLVGVALVAQLTGLATAADLAVYKARPPAPVWSWTGFYGGANVGYGWDRRDVGLSFAATDPQLAPALAATLAAGSFPASLSPSADGLIGGLQIGYNWQIGTNWLFGFEADIQGSGIKGTASEARFPQFFDATSTTVEKKIDWFGTVRARLGVLATPTMLLYATGGLAYGKTEISFNTVDADFGCIPFGTLCANGTSSGVKVGWTAGGGVEAMMWNNWTFKAEYLYLDLGSRSVDIPSFTLPIIVTPSTDFREHVVRVGVNYHFNAGPVVARY
jgi:outer membrane immunogenic protein